MEMIKIYRKIKLDNPVLIAGWPGMGNVALGAIDYLRRNLRGMKFAEIDQDKSLGFDAVKVESGIAKLPPPAKNVFYYAKTPDLIIFEGDVQVSGEAGVIVMNAILDLALRLGVKRVFTGAAFPILTSHAEPSSVYGVVNRRLSKGFLARHGIKPMEDGHISGLNGLLLGFAENRGVEAACLLATMPQYATGFNNPKASRAIVQVLGRILGFKLDLRQIDAHIRQMDDRMAVIEKKVKEVFSVEERAEKPASAGFETKKKIPEYIIQKIERLFRETKKDKSKAVMLKRELDRWDLYALYEDRFLNLFKDRQ